MSLKDKAEAKGQQILGAAQEKVGDATGNDRIAEQGRENHAEGRLKEVVADVTETVADAAEKVKDAAEDLADKAGRLFKK
ncbi:CsbD family protein [Microbacterium azadirachtae]|uniref:CsbD-like protein n=1 Tax=Microbacterium azadirachtae TaxID=582680 RepID=A0A0F0KP53_9MICO|nr:hypothetical protein [Microbacterium azadirachtae]KJL21905.1 CsbD-like protein [Microbacterium azadirachtae]UXW86144.1 hypothetical protein NFX31_00955 [Microbacterium azadirachtae]SDL62266.1 hypothetical protein SAMN04488593_1353 [Microbacterium azadirachtae]SEF91129.1 hypothetical protein SAMN04488594_1340 [Microbacterium azadirachtae]SEF93138.1 hypothetical protein SAMN04488592_1350 [Microbacterium azadirachtae]